MHCACVVHIASAKDQICTNIACSLLAVQYEVLVASGQPANLSPLDLARRTLVKGKVKQLKEFERTSKRRRTSKLSRARSLDDSARRSVWSLWTTSSRVSRITRSSSRSDGQTSNIEIPTLSSRHSSEELIGASLADDMVRYSHSGQSRNCSP